MSDLIDVKIATDASRHLVNFTELLSHISF